MESARDEAKVVSSIARVRAYLAAPFVWWAREASAKDPLDQTAWERGQIEAISAAKDGRLFGLFATVTTCAAPTAVGFATVHLPMGVQLALIVLAAVVGYLLVPTLWALSAAIRAPVKQRDELRDRLRPSTINSLAEEFADWVRVKRAALPSRGWRQVAGLFPSPGVSADTHARLRGDSEARRDAVEAIQAEARSEYQERFRSRVVAALGGTALANEPITIRDLGTLAEELSRTVGVAPKDNRSELEAEKHQVADRLNRVANEIQSHHDAREVQQPPAPVEFGQVSAMARRMAGEVDKVTAYERETVALYYHKYRPEAAGAYKEALRLHGGRADRLPLIEKPEDVAGLVTAVAYLRDAAAALTGD